MEFNQELSDKVIFNLNGREWAYPTSYRLFIEYCIITTNKDKEKIVPFLEKARLPIAVETIEFLNSLYFPKPKYEIEQKKSNYELKYDILWDLIYSAFWQQYKIDLVEVDIHFEKFKTLLNGLKNTVFNDVLGAWAKDLKGLKGEELEYYKTVRKQYPLGINVVASTAEERDKKMKEYVAKRFEEVKKNGG